MAYTIKYPTTSTYMAQNGASPNAISRPFGGRWLSGWARDLFYLVPEVHTMGGNVGATVTMAEVTAGGTETEVVLRRRGTTTPAYPLVSLGGGVPGGTNAVKFSTGTITPTWAVPAGEQVYLAIEKLGSSAAQVIFRCDGLTEESPTGTGPVGVPQSWDLVDFGTTSVSVPPASPIGSYMNVAGWQGPWATSDGSGAKLVMRAVVGPVASTVTTPIQGGNIPVTVGLAGTPTPTLTSAGGATDNGDGTVTVAAGQRANIVWSGCSGTIRLTMTKGAGTGVVSYSPFYLDTPPIPPPAPTITKLIPTVGPDTGGTLVDVIGTDLTGATAVDFGGTAGTGLTVDPSGNLATVTSPAHTAGPAPVTITTPAGASAAKTFTYEAPLPPGPVVVAVIPGAALPGATIQIVGTNLTGATVTMCGDPVDIVSNDGNIITVAVPPGCPDGPATITITTPDGETTAGLTVLPASGPTGGPDVIANLVALLASELGVPVSSRRSPTATKDSDPSVVVRRTGGPSKGVASDNPTITIEAWAPTTTESFQLLQSARLVVIEAAEQGRAGLRRYDEFAGPADLPDPSTTNPRHTLTASVVTRLE